MTVPSSPIRTRLLDRRGHTLIDFEANGFRYTAGLGFFEDGRLAEVFLNAGKIGTAIETAARDSAVVASIALQHGVPPDTIRHALTRDRNGNASGPLGTLLDLLSESAP
jgi:ribonucleoside-diphosphate reductase alpha chain